MVRAKPSEPKCEKYTALKCQRLAVNHVALTETDVQHDSGQKAYKNKSVSFVNEK